MKILLYLIVYFFLPAAGQRMDADGELYIPGINGYYWTSLSRSSANAVRMMFSSSVSATVVDSYIVAPKARAKTIRCVRYEIKGGFKE